MSIKHALLSASSSDRWLACPPSALLNKKFEDVPSSFAQEGTDAHSLAQYKLEKALGIDTKDPTKSLSFYNEEMNDHAENYAAFCLNRLRKQKKPALTLRYLLNRSLISQDMSRKVMVMSTACLLQTAL